MIIEHGCFLPYPSQLIVCNGCNAASAAEVNKNTNDEDGVSL